MLLLCYSLIDTNTIPFYFSTVSDRKSRTMHSAVRTYRIISSVSLLILRVLSHGRSIYFYFADASARTSSDRHSTCGASKLLYYRTKVCKSDFGIILQNGTIKIYLVRKSPNSLTNPCFIEQKSIL